MIATTLHRKTSSDHQPRRGLVSVSVIIALIVIGIICAGLLKVALARRSEIGIEERRLQAEWLVASGLERAAALLLSSKDYAGETWEIPAEELGGRGAGTVVIAVETVPDHPDRKKVRVQAVYPKGSTFQARQTQEILMPVTTHSR